MSRLPEPGPEAPSVSWWRSALLAVLLQGHRLAHARGLGWLWKLLHDVGSRSSAHVVAVRVHGRVMIQPFGYTYPLFARWFPHLNDPLVELVHRAARQRGRPVRVVDVGAAIGDTAILLDTNVPGDLGEVVCVDGDPEFGALLLENLNRVRSGRAILAVLAAGEEEEVGGLLRIHAGSASAQGAAKVRGTSLDAVLEAHGVGVVDVLKTDVDGYDGRVLAGSTRVLRRDRPEVIFEWYPQLYRATGTSLLEPFEVLEACGYDRFVWFTKYGLFSHVTGARETGGLRILEEVCAESDVFPGWHYDVVALHGSSALRAAELAALRYGSHRRVAV